MATEPGPGCLLLASSDKMNGELAQLSQGRNPIEVADRRAMPGLVVQVEVQVSPTTWFVVMGSCSADPRRSSTATAATWFRSPARDQATHQLAYRRTSQAVDDFVDLTRFGRQRRVDEAGEKPQRVIAVTG